METNRPLPTSKILQRLAKTLVYKLKPNEEAKELNGVGVMILCENIFKEKIRHNPDTEVEV